MYRCASGYGNGSIRMFSITLKIAVDAPIPSASVKIATTANPASSSDSSVRTGHPAPASPLSPLNHLRCPCRLCSRRALTRPCLGRAHTRPLHRPALPLNIYALLLVIKFDATAPKKLPDWPKTSLRREDGPDAAYSFKYMAIRRRALLRQYLEAWHKEWGKERTDSLSRAGI